jgi:hypothetical protein
VRMQKGQGSKSQIWRKTRTWKIRHEGPPWTRSASFSTSLIGQGLVKMSQRHTGVIPLLLWAHDDDVRRGKDSV